MNLREEEDRLFERWKSSYGTKSFVTDGCPHPAIYLSQERKVVFVLKDGNLGEAPNENNTFDQRGELESSPHPWWTTIACWCFLIANPDDTWRQALSKIGDSVTIKMALSAHCFIQLKKTWGGGSVSNQSLEECVATDRDYIISQLSIYTPQFIVACGNGDQLRSVFGTAIEEAKETTFGVRYWRVDLSGATCYLVDYCHPSIRVGTKVKGLIAKGLIGTILEIEKLEATA